MTRTRAGHWESQATVGESMPADRERAARRALGEADPVVGPTPTEICFPMIIGGVPEGVLGVAPEPTPTDHQRSVLSAAAALLAVSLKNSELFREVRENSVRDGLTGCFNRMHALEVLDAELRRARRSRLPLSLVMFDLDNFKGINDRHGHLCGDAVLAAVGATMKAELRGSDLKCRYGGDEFMVILPTRRSSVRGRCREPASRDRRTSRDLERRTGDGHRQLRDHRNHRGRARSARRDFTRGYGALSREAARAERNRAGRAPDGPGELVSAVLCARGARRRTERKGHRPFEDDLPVDAREAIQLSHAASESLDPRFDFHDVSGTHRTPVAHALDADEERNLVAVFRLGQDQDRAHLRDALSEDRRRDSRCRAAPSATGNVRSTKRS